MNNKARDPPSPILLLILTSLPHSFPLTNEYLFSKFSDFGEIKKILIFERGKTNKAFVEFYQVKCAIQARRQLNGLNIQGGKMIIHFSRLKNLNLEIVDNSRGTDYTSSTNSENFLLSKTDDHINLNNIPSKSSSSRANSSPVRNEEINHLLDSDDDQIDLSIWKQEFTFPNNDMSADVQMLLRQRPSRLIRISQIDIKITAKMIYNVFSKFGNIEELLYEKQYQQAFIKYQTISQATIAKEFLNNALFFDSLIRIFFEPIQSLQPTSMQDEYMIYYNGTTPKKTMPLSTTLLVNGVSNETEISEMLNLVAQIKDIKLQSNSLILTMNSISDTLKIMAVFSDYEYNNQKLSILLQ